MAEDRLTITNEQTPLLVEYHPERPLAVGRMRSYTPGDLITQHNQRVRRNRQDSIASVATWQSEVSVLESIKDFVEQRWPSMTTQRLVAAVLWGLVAVGVWSLVFLPRTSLGRDYRRLHFSQLTRDDTQRLFVLSLGNDSREHVAALSSASHLPADGDGAAQYVVDELRRYELDPDREVYYAWVMKHESSSIWLWQNETVIYSPTLTETAPFTREEVIASHAYSPTGNVTAHFIFVNYGSTEDYELLTAQGVPLNGTIHIARTRGGVTTSLKVKHAEDHGALAVITYTDPADDGPITVANGFEAYPEGPARSPHAVERSSLLLTSKAPGDPTTPGHASWRASKRTPPDVYIPQIPAIPMSSDAITPILTMINSFGMKTNWCGDIPFDYSSGPSTSRLSLMNSATAEIRAVKNIMYTIPGLLSDTIVLGAHRDSPSSVNGAGSAHSGTAVLLEISRAFASLIKRGWRPLRTIVVASWDAEELGAIGSTEFGEANEELHRNGIAYIDLNGVIGKNLEAVTHPLLSAVLEKTGKKLNDKITLNNVPSPQPSVFQHHLGIPTCSIGFSSSNTAPLHHNSAFDTPHWLETYIDPDYSLHHRLSTFAGLLTIQLSEHEVLSYSTSRYTKHIMLTFQEVVRSLPTRWLTRTTYWRHADVSLPLALQDMFTSLEELQTVTRRFDERAKEIQEQISVDYAWFKFYVKLRLAFETKWMDNRAREMEKTLMTKGLTDRDWYKSGVYAPDRHDGGETVTLPGLVEAVEDGDIEEFTKWMRDLDERVSRLKVKMRV